MYRIGDISGLVSYSKKHNINSVEGEHPACTTKGEQNGKKSSRKN